jgi:hypothetical protein
VLAAALPKVQLCLQDANALGRESGMLALGALSTGCMDEMAVYLPQLFPLLIQVKLDLAVLCAGILCFSKRLFVFPNRCLFLTQSMTDSLPEMRAISCWVLSRYCCLFYHLGMSEQEREQTEGFSTLGENCYITTVQALLTAMFDPTPRVQVAACSAVGVLVENCYSASLLNRLLPSILSAINRAFAVYGVKSALLLVDTIGTIADTVRSDLKQPQYTALYLPQLMQRFDSLEDFGE